MSRVLFTIALFISFLSQYNYAYSTAQVPDLLIYNGDTLMLFSNPLEFFYNETNPKPVTFVETNCSSTACWRGYQATWLIENDSLYLIKIDACCFIDRYQLTEQSLSQLTHYLPLKLVDKIRKHRKRTIYTELSFGSFLKTSIGKKNYFKFRDIIKKLTVLPRKTADLARFFPKKYQNGRVKADWFNGMLRVPKGKLLNYHHSGYESIYQYEWTFEVEQGTVLEIQKFTNKSRRLEEGMGFLSTKSCSFFFPEKYLNSKSYQSFLKDTITYTDHQHKINIYCEAHANGRRFHPEMRKIQTAFKLDSLLNLLDNYGFEESIYEIVQPGTLGRADGYNKNTGEYIRVVTLMNINRQMILLFRMKSDYGEFYELAQLILETMTLKEYNF